MQYDTKTKDCYIEGIIISLQEVIKMPLKGNVPDFDNCRGICFTCIKIIPY